MIHRALPTTVEKLAETKTQMPTWNWHYICEVKGGKMMLQLHHLGCPLCKRKKTIKAVWNNNTLNFDEFIREHDCLNGFDQHDFEAYPQIEIPVQLKTVDMTLEYTNVTAQFELTAYSTSQKLSGVFTSHEDRKRLVWLHEKARKHSNRRHEHTR